MKPRKANYIVHRWLGLIVSLQLLAWSTGGFLFSILAIDNVRGERDTAGTPYEPMSVAAIEALPLSIRHQVVTRQSLHTNIGTIRLCDRGLGAAWEVRSVDGEFVARLGVVAGEQLGDLTEDDARFVATRDFVHAAAVGRVDYIQSDPPTEYRNGVLPAYVVAFDHPKRPHIYVDARTGEISARRNRSWRIFDFFWMLHTMDYAGRDDFNHPLLTAFSVLAIGTSGSGLALWSWRALPRRRSGRPIEPVRAAAFQPACRDREAAAVRRSE